MTAHHFHLQGDTEDESCEEVMMEHLKNGMHSDWTFPDVQMRAWVWSVRVRMGNETKISIWPWPAQSQVKTGKHQEPAVKDRAKHRLPNSPPLLTHTLSPIKSTLPQETNRHICIRAQLQSSSTISVWNNWRYPHDNTFINCTETNCINSSLQKTIIIHFIRIWKLPSEYPNLTRKQEAV